MFHSNTPDHNKEVIMTRIALLVVTTVTENRSLIYMWVNYLILILRLTTLLTVVIFIICSHHCVRSLRRVGHVLSSSLMQSLKENSFSLVDREPSKEGRLGGSIHQSTFFPNNLHYLLIQLSSERRVPKHSFGQGSQVPTSKAPTDLWERGV